MLSAIASTRVLSKHSRRVTSFRAAVRCLSTYSAPEKLVYKPRPSSVSVGQEGTLEWRKFFMDAKNKPMSPWHDIPMRNEEDSQLFNFLNEIPRGERAKMEVATKELKTPIKQDTKKGELRFFKYGDMPFNYGCIPQTWEDPNTVHPDTGYAGDNDPVDVVELSDESLPIGEIVSVKVLGILGMIDDDETDWKVVALRSDHPKADAVNDINDVEEHFPGAQAHILNWFRNYKIPDGKAENKFSHNEEFQNKEYAVKIIEETNESWVKLMDGDIPANGLNLDSTLRYNPFDELMKQRKLDLESLSEKKE